MAGGTPKLLYAHGFASGPRSTKGVAIAEHLARRGLALELLDLRLPGGEAAPGNLRVSAMIDAVGKAIDGTPQAVLMGSSLGALVAARVAERDPRVVATLLFAPAFRIADPACGPFAPLFSRWREEGSLEFPDYATSGVMRVPYAFVEDAQLVDGGDPRDDLRWAEGFGRFWPDVRVRTTIVHGLRDASAPIDHSRRFAKGRPYVRLVEVDDDHQLVASVPRICKEIDRLLAELAVG